MASRVVIQVLMTAYNSQKYVAQQVQSILQQTSMDGTRLELADVDLEIVVRDNASTDGTVAIIRDLQARHPGRVRLLPGDGRNLGALRGFALLLDQARPGYVMFSDADDVWLPGKIALTLAKMRELESRDGADRPVLVHTDARVVDRDLNVIADSFRRYQFIDPLHGSTLNRLLVQNVAMGCTLMLNGPLVELARPVPVEAIPLPQRGGGVSDFHSTRRLTTGGFGISDLKERTSGASEELRAAAGAIMHDWWIALVAGAMGTIGYVPEATLLYRQHGSNFTGAKAWGPGTMARAAWSFLRDDSMRRSLGRTHGQAAALLRALDGRLPSPQRSLIAAYASLPQRSYLDRRRLVFRHHFFKTGLTRNLGMLAAL